MFTIPLLLLPAAPVLTSWRATCKAARAQLVVHAARRQQPAAPAADSDSWASTVERRKASFSYSAPAGAPASAQHTNTPPAKQPQPSSRSSKRRQQQHQKQPAVQPDPAANDLDALAAQAATVAPTASGNSSSSSSGTMPTSRADIARPSVIYSVPAADQRTRAAAAMQPDAGRQLRYTAADKLHLTAEAAWDIARRLRKAGPPKPGQPVLRVFR
jgi:hypothetical protein